VLPAIGPFDELLGAGTRYVSEDRDFGYRALRAGLRVEVSHDPAVVHFGARQAHEVAALNALYLAGFGAMAAKHIRCGDLFMARVLAKEFNKWFGQGMGHLTHARRPSGLGHARALVSGVAGSLRYGVDPRSLLFHERGKSMPSPATLIARAA
jgi:hypothetical protein